MSSQPYAPAGHRGAPAGASYGGLAASTLPQARYPEAALSAVVQYVGRARRAVARGDVEGAHESLIRAQQVLTLLRGALDREAGGELADRLATVYTFVIGELGQANVHKDAARLESLPAIVEPLREAFARAAKAHLAGRPGEAARARGGDSR